MESLTCTVCGEPYLPSGRWQDDTCPECFRENFQHSDELRVQGEVEPGGSLTLTPRQVQAMRRIAARHQQDGEEEG